ncbi:MAG: hypothetical protein KDD62_10260 [Bdellovibrionales bacterium]|nr:hypothetical protein [Bdellovibrionales bacterium]
MSQNHINAFLLIFFVSGAVGFVVWLIHRNPQGIDDIEREVKETEKYFGPLFSGRKRSFLKLYRIYPVLGGGAFLWTLILMFIGFSLEAFCLSAFLFGFGLLSSRAADVSGRSSRYHYLGIASSFMGMLAAIFPHT